jgi:hypothetical protein
VDNTINIDRLVSPELRAELAAVTADVCALEDQLTELGERAATASARFEHALRGATDDDFAHTSVVSGHEALFFACLETADQLTAWTGSEL